MESIWGNDCCEYKPERWIENGVCRQESPFKYPVFHAGPRMCLGKDRAFILMKSIAASVLERFKMDVLLEKGIMASYIVFLCWTAMRSEPGSEKCSPQKQETGHIGWAAIVGFVVALCAIVIATFSTGIDSQSFQRIITTGTLEAVKLDVEVLLSNAESYFGKDAELFNENQTIVRLVQKDAIVLVVLTKTQFCRQH
ncbi:cytochrome p450 704c1 [Phtheirospermum japonicum]|uniref:Cytochrome p450 704c1 n=1 Tax=Phtheirospermum japonicum TaxID=374723 RepID=A0A830D548_9LAMI|nr:cytochrome p450 704c1 [Phtheirospermum japonicum]